MAFNSDMMDDMGQYSDTRPISSRVEFWPTAKDGEHVVLIEDRVVTHVGVLWLPKE